jgi:hypothetical protein
LEKSLIKRGLKELEENQDASLEKYDEEMQRLVRQEKTKIDLLKLNP